MHVSSGDLYLQKTVTACAWQMWHCGPQTATVLLILWQIGHTYAGQADALRCESERAEMKLCSWKIWDNKFVSQLCGHVLCAFLYAVCFCLVGVVQELTSVFYSWYTPHVSSISHLSLWQWSCLLCTGVKAGKLIRQLALTCLKGVTLAVFV